MKFPYNKASSSSQTLPLVIGFTGHRAFPGEDVSAIERMVRDIYQTLHIKYPSTPIVLLTSLAEGADRFGAHIAIELGIEFIVPLPMKPEAYETDFESEVSRQEFQYLLSKSSRWFALPLVEGVTEESIAEPGYDRNLQYAQVGAYLARYSQILIAVWDGIPVELLGGTSTVVNYKLQGIPEIFGPPQSPLDPVETGPVYHIVARRKDNPNVSGEPLTLKKYFPRGHQSAALAEEFFEKIYERINAFNQDIIHYEKYLLSKKKQSAEYLFPSEHEHSLSDALKTARDYYTSADILASYFQRFTNRSFIGIFGCVFIAAFFFDIYAHAFENTLVLGGYLGSLLLAFLWYRAAKKKQYQTKYLDYRALAEGLRVQFFWEYAGIHESAGDYYLRKQKSELDWIRYALRTMAIPSDDESFSPREHTNESRYDRFELLLNSWIGDQAKYYPRAMKRDHNKLFKLEMLINFFFAMGIGLVVVQLTIEPQDVLTMVIGLAPVVAALLGGYIERNALVGHIKQYERMGELFAHAKDWLQKLLTEGKRHEASEFIIEIGKEALSENGDWMLLHRERPLAVPKG